MKFTLIALTFASLLPVTGLAQEAESGFTESRCRGFLINQAERQYERKRNSGGSTDQLSLRNDRVSEARVMADPCKRAIEEGLEEKDSEPAAPVRASEDEVSGAPFSQ